MEIRMLYSNKICTYILRATVCRYGITGMVLPMISKAANLDFPVNPMGKLLTINFLACQTLFF